MEKDLKFKLVNISNPRFDIIEDNVKEDSKISLATGIDLAINPMDYEVALSTSFTFDTKKSIFLKVELECIFEIEKKDWKKNVQKNKITLPKEFLQHLARITIGASRGVMFSKLEGTSLETLFLPLISVSEIFLDDATFDIEDE